MNVIKLFNQEQVDLILKDINDIDWEDGKNTARGDAKDIKNNLQITGASEKGAAVIRKIENTLLKNNTFVSFTFVKKLVGLRFANYKDGGNYGWHVDLSTMQGYRTDLSFTVFLSDPNSYDGGELQANYGYFGGLKKFKGEIGDMVIYPTGVVHQVTPVVSGERIVVVGWISSHIKSPQDREALFNLQIARNELKDLIGKVGDEKLDKGRAGELLDRVNESYFNLARTLSE